jgi:hypothetical protein
MVLTATAVDAFPVAAELVDFFPFWGVFVDMGSS